MPKSISEIFATISFFPTIRKVDLPCNISSHVRFKTYKKIHVLPLHDFFQDIKEIKIGTEVAEYA